MLFWHAVLRAEAHQISGILVAIILRQEDDQDAVLLGVAHEPEHAQVGALSGRTAVKRQVPGRGLQFRQDGRVVIDAFVDGRAHGAFERVNDVLRVGRLSNDQRA